MGRHKNTKKKTGRKKNKGLPDLESTSVPTQRKGGCVGPNILKYLMVPSVAGGLGYKPDPAMIWPETGWDDTDNESPFNKLDYYRYYKFSIDDSWKQHNSVQDASIIYEEDKMMLFCREQFRLAARHMKHYVDVLMRKNLTLLWSIRLLWQYPDSWLSQNLPPLLQLNELVDSAHLRKMYFGYMALESEYTRMVGRSKFSHAILDHGALLRHYHTSVSSYLPKGLFSYDVQPEKLMTILTADLLKINYDNANELVRETVIFLKHYKFKSEEMPSNDFFTTEFNGKQYNHSNVSAKDDLVADESEDCHNKIRETTDNPVIKPKLNSLKTMSNKETSLSLQMSENNSTASPNISQRNTTAEVELISSRTVGDIRTTDVVSEEKRTNVTNSRTNILDCNLTDDNKGNSGNGDCQLQLSEKNCLTNQSDKNNPDLANKQRRKATCVMDEKPNNLINSTSDQCTSVKYVSGGCNSIKTDNIVSSNREATSNTVNIITDEEESFRAPKLSNDNAAAEAYAVQPSIGKMENIPKDSLEETTSAVDIIEEKNTADNDLLDGGGYNNTNDKQVRFITEVSENKKYTATSDHTDFDENILPDEGRDKLISGFSDEKETLSASDFTLDEDYNTTNEEIDSSFTTVSDDSEISTITNLTDDIEHNFGNDQRNEFMIVLSEQKDNIATTNRTCEVEPNCTNGVIEKSEYILESSEEHIEEAVLCLYKAASLSSLSSGLEVSYSMSSLGETNVLSSESGISIGSKGFETYIDNEDLGSENSLISVLNASVTDYDFVSQLDKYDIRKSKSNDSICSTGFEVDVSLEESEIDPGLASYWKERELEYVR